LYVIDLLLLLRETYECCKFKIERQIWSLISQLKIIYSIQPTSDNRGFTINGFRLPNSDFTGCDEEHIATSLGFVCHLIFMISKYLEVSNFF
jgi:hypothetical protein